MTGKIKDITVRFNADTKSLLESQGVFDKINEKVKQQEGLINQLTEQEKELLALRNKSHDPKQVETYNKQLSEIRDKQNTLKTQTESLTTSHQKFNSTLLQIGSSLGVAFGVSEVINFGKESIRAFIDAEKNAKRLEFAITKIAGATKASFNTLIEQSEKLQSISIFSSGDVQNAQTMLLQFGLNTRQVEKLIPKILDLAAAQGVSLSQATDKVVSAINGQGKSLRDAGIIMDDTGSKTENLTIVMDKLGKFSGASGDAIESTSGKLSMFGNEVDTLKEKVGGFLIEAGSSFVDFFQQYINPFGYQAQKIADDALQHIKDVDKAIKEELTGMSEQAIRHRIKISNEILALDEQYKLQKKAFGVAPSIVSNEQVYEAKRNIAIAEQLLKEKHNFESDLTASGLAKQEEAARKAADAKKKQIEEEEAAELKQKENRTDRLMKQQEEGEQARKKELEDHEKFLQEKYRREAELRDQAFEDELQATQAKVENQQNIENASMDAVVKAGDTLIEIKKSWDQQETDSQLENIERQKDQKIITEQQYQALRRDILRKQWQADREAAITKVMMEWGVASIKAASSAPWPYNLPAMIAASAAGSSALAQVLAQPEPKFAKGVIDLQGKGTGTSDDISAKLSRGESVMTADETKEHKDLFLAIRNKKFEDYIAKEYIEPMIMKSANSSFAENINQSLKLQFDTYAFARELRRNNKVEVINMPQNFGMSYSEFQLMKRRGLA